MVVDSAFGDNFDAYYSKPVTPGDPSPNDYFTKHVPSTTSAQPESLLNSYFDGSASWFT
jgi:dethiobiotin synthetase/adenosylmethionine--8-amino-7-oxononanoate aminotransferase